MPVVPGRPAEDAARSAIRRASIGAIENVAGGAPPARPLFIASAALAG